MMLSLNDSLSLRNTPHGNLSFVKNTADYSLSTEVHKAQRMTFSVALCTSNINIHGTTRLCLVLGSLPTRRLRLHHYCLR